MAYALRIQSLPPEERMPTAAEIQSFDAAAAWDRMTPDQQRHLGLIAVEMATSGGLLSFENNYRGDELGLIQRREDAALHRISTEFEPIWHIMFGWADTTSTAA